MRKIKPRLLIFLLLSYFLNLNISVYAVELTQGIKENYNSIQLEADSAILIDAVTGDILYGKEIDKKEYPASITKLMTVLLALENCDMNEKITFSDEAVFSIEPGSSHIAINPDEEITIEQALYAIMLQSANEVSNGVAEHIDGSLDKFAEHMTKRAKELGAKNTNFVNANGLHDENHYTTAYDMALIAQELLKYPQFKQILSSTYYEIPPTNKQTETRYLHGQTQLIKPSSSFYYENCEGGKTGFTDQARNTLVSYAKNDNIEVISVVLHSTGYGEYTDTIQLFDYGLKNFKTVEICKSGDVCQSAKVVSEGLLSDETQEINTYYNKDISVTIPLEYSQNDIKTYINIPEELQPPINYGKVIGNVKYTLNDKEIASADIISKTEIGTQAIPVMASSEENLLKYKIKVSLIFASIAVLFVLVLRTVIIKINYRNQRRKRRKRLEQYREENFHNIETSLRNRRYR